MTGEMSREDVSREEFPLYFAIADAVGGTVEPFDVYQGPYISTDKGDLWMVPDDKWPEYEVRIYNQRTEARSFPFNIHQDDSALFAVMAAQSVL